MFSRSESKLRNSSQYSAPFGLLLCLSSCRERFDGYNPAFAFSYHDRLGENSRAAGRKQIGRRETEPFSKSALAEPIGSAVVNEGTIGGGIGDFQRLRHAIVGGMHEVG
jgi:hypothetical protein